MFIKMNSPYYLVSFLTFISHIYRIDCDDPVPTYAITAPKILRLRDDYNVIVSLHNVSEQTDVICILKREQLQLNNHTIEDGSSGTRTFDKDHSTQYYNLQANKLWTEGVYKLYCHGTGGLSFSQVIDINLVYKQYLIMVQSDKAIYRPGETVLFRVLILEDSLLPANKEDIQDLKIYIIDPLDNKLRLFFLKEDQFNNQTDFYGTNRIKYIKGVTNDISFPIQDEAMLGKWQIRAVTRGQIQNYAFFVDNYQLPLANVTITLPEYVTYNNTNLEYIVDCFYTFGKPVEGSVKLLFTKSSECGSIVKDALPVWSSTVSLINGQISNTIDLSSAKLLNPNCSEMRYNVTAIVTDNITKSNYTNFEVFDIYKNDIRTQLISNQLKFKPGKTIRQHVRVLSIAGESLSKHLMEKITCEAEFKTEIGQEFIKITSTKMKNDETNIVCDFKTDITSTEIHSRIKHGDDLLLNSTFQSFPGCKKTFVQVMLQNPLEKLEANNQLNLEISSNEPIKQIIYYIVVRGSIILMNQQNYQIANEKQILSIELTRRMVPEAIVAVFFTSPASGIIVSDSLTLQLSGLFHSEVTFDVKTPLINSSEKALMYINAESESKLFILGVDEAVLALKQGNDITEKRVLNELKYTFHETDSASGFLQSGMEFKTNGPSECSSYYETIAIEKVEIEDKNTNDVTNSIRKNFRETWIWDTISIDHNEKKVGIKARVPDSMTSWRLTAFSIHDDNGLGLTKIPGHVTVRKPFFIKLNVPHSIKRKETSELHVLAFNYLDDTADVKIDVMVNSTEDKKIVALKDCSFNPKMKPNEIKTFTCFVTAHDIGKIDLLAQASAESRSTTVKDGELRPLIVAHEGFVQHDSTAVFFDLTNNEGENVVTEIAKVDYPIEAIEGTKRLYASATAQLITTPWKGELDSLVKQHSITADFNAPTKCCQQRTVYYYPKVYWLDYLKKSKKITKNETEFAEKVIQKTIQLLCFQNPNDGSFVTWNWNTGETYDNNNVKLNAAPSNVWQTAYTFKLMNHAKEYVTVDPKMILNTKNWLKQKQLESGEFNEIDYRIISTTNFNAYLTSYVYIALNSSDTREVNPKAEKYLAEIFDSLTHPLDIVITCYALHIANHQIRDECYNKVLKLSVSENGLTFFKGADHKPDLQVTAYALMTLNIRKSNAIALGVFKYLLSRQYPNGWFIESNGGVWNSLTTVVCTEAMTQYIYLMSNYDPNIEKISIDFEVGDKKQSLHIKPENEILQRLELNSDTKEVKLTATGYGRAVAKIYWQFNTLNQSGKSFGIDKEKINTNGEEYITLKVCLKYNLQDEITNAILEIDLPSGYIYDREGHNDVSELIHNIESTNSDTHVNVYLKKVTKTQVCISIPAIQSFKVTNTQPILLKAYAAFDKNLFSIEPWNTAKPN